MLMERSPINLTIEIPHRLIDRPRVVHFKRVANRLDGQVLWPVPNPIIRCDDCKRARRIAISESR